MRGCGSRGFPNSDDRNAVFDRDREFVGFDIDVWRRSASTSCNRKQSRCPSGGPSQQRRRIPGNAMWGDGADRQMRLSGARSAKRIPLRSSPPPPQPNLRRHTNVGDDKRRFPIYKCQLSSDVAIYRRFCMRNCRKCSERQFSYMKNVSHKGEHFIAANAPAFREAPVFSRGPPLRRDRGARS